ncbi:MAG: hypothetical protein ACPGRZ_17550 [Alphaproteobacteria bacterium]
MIDRSNRQVLASLEDGTGLRCVDIYRTRDGGVLWDEWRRDPEDPSGWHATGRCARSPSKNETDARDAATAAIEWLAD